MDVLTYLIVHLSVRSFIVLSEILFEDVLGESGAIGDGELVLDERQPAVRPSGWNSNQQPAQDVVEEL